MLSPVATHGHGGVGLGGKAGLGLEPGQTPRNPARVGQRGGGESWTLGLGWLPFPSKSREQSRGECSGRAVGGWRRN